MRHSRFKKEKRLRKDGELKGLVLADGDLQVMESFSSMRKPWGYKQLSTRHLKAIVNRPNVDDRFRRLYEQGYLARPEQPKSCTRELIYTIGKLGMEELKKANLIADPSKLRAPHGVANPHQVLCDITAASFELATRTQPITLQPYYIELKGVIPDRRPFKVTTPDGDTPVILEIDMSSEPYSVIDGKLDHYVPIIESGKHPNLMVLFICIYPSRVTGLIETLKNYIDKNKLPHWTAQQFGFRWIEFGRFLSTMPLPSDWAVTGDYQRAGSAAPFNFLKERSL